MKTQKIIYLLMVLTIGTSLMAQQSAKEATGLIVGTKAPIFEAEDANKQIVKLDEMLKQGPLVLFFYRGQWCPYCNRHLHKLQKDLPLLHEKGINIVAVTPEKPEYIEEMANKTGASFTIIYDHNYEIAKAYGVNFQLSDKLKNRYNRMLDANLEDAHQSDTPNLPIPATYLINTDGTIIWRHFDPDYKKRASVDEILKHIP